MAVLSAVIAARSAEAKPSMDAGALQQEVSKETSQDTMEKDKAEQNIQGLQEEPPAEALGKKSEQYLRVPDGMGPDADDVERTRDQDQAASLSF
jgi:hypothetical protein